MNWEYSSYEELIDNIRDINRKLYFPTLEQIAYLEELRNTNIIIYNLELRNTYSHLVMVLNHPDIIDNKQIINNELNKYYNHLVKLAIESCRLIINTYIEEIIRHGSSAKEKYSFQTQIAKKISQLRVKNETDSYRQFLKYKELEAWLETECKNLS